MNRIVIPAAALLVLAACNAAPADQGREVGTWLDPVCGSDGSVVRRIYPNPQGSYDTPAVSRDNCPWNKPKT